MIVSLGQLKDAKHFTRGEDEVQSEQTEPCVYAQGGHYMVMLIAICLQVTTLSKTVILTSDCPDARRGKVAVKQLECRSRLEGWTLSDNGLSHGRVAVDKNLSETH